MSTRGAALETLRRCAQALEGDLSTEERARLCALQCQAIQFLADPHKPATLARAERIRQLEAKLADMPAGERAAAIMERMPIGRTMYYRLRKLQYRNG
jgi:hypothetical protein